MVCFVYDGHNVHHIVTTDSGLMLRGTINGTMMVTLNITVVLIYCHKRQHISTYL